MRWLLVSGRMIDEVDHVASANRGRSGFFQEHSHRHADAMLVMVGRTPACPIGRVLQELLIETIGGPDIPEATRRSIP